MSSKQENEPLLSPVGGSSSEGDSRFGGHKVAFTVADLFSSPPSLAVAYHSIAFPLASFTPVGAMVGGSLSLAGVSKAPFLAAAGTGGMYAACGGICIGILGFCAKAVQGDKAEPIPWNKEGIEDRAKRLKVNFPARVLDQGAWLGVAAGGITYGVAGLTLGFSSGAIGVVQALCVGSSVGSIGSALCMKKLHTAK